MSAVQDSVGVALHGIGGQGVHLLPRIGEGGWGDPVRLPEGALCRYPSRDEVRDVGVNEAPPQLLVDGEQLRYAGWVVPEDGPPFAVYGCAIARHVVAEPDPSIIVRPPSTLLEDFAHDWEQRSDHMNHVARWRMRLRIFGGPDRATVFLASDVERLTPRPWWDEGGSFLNSGEVQAETVIMQRGLDGESVLVITYAPNGMDWVNGVHVPSEFFTRHERHWGGSGTSNHKITRAAVERMVGPLAS